ncbi:MAG: molybdopterin molybdotransferase MoeA [Actinomycetota bacterium]|nr:molybdopterin molybdotransferase MoeA [Actinomycetota bacterium]
MAEPMLAVDEARREVLGAVQPLEPRDTLVGDALGGVLAVDLFAPHPLPRFDNSAMDGYAVRAADVTQASEGAPVQLDVAGEVRAGDPGELEVVAGAAVRIMTGAPVPKGADGIVPVEDTSEQGGRVIIRRPTAAGRHVRPSGDDVAEGDALVRGGSELGPGELALLASMGFSPLPMRPGPKVAVLVTGDELVAPEATAGPGQIRDSNSVAIRALVTESGGEVVPFGGVADTPEAVIEALKRAGATADLVVSSGGVSVGRYDFVKDAVEKLGHIDLWRVAMQPGKPVVLGAIGATPFLGLPGNPVSIHIGFEQFVRPAIRKMRGCRDLLRPTMDAILTEAIEKPPGRLHFVRVRLSPGADGWRATPTGAQGSHVQSSLVDCHGVARFGRDETALEAGSNVVVEVWRLPGEEA